jgi:uncharacterized membrane protein
MRGFKERGGQVTRVEAFVDAAFAFAVTLMAIAGQEIPDSIDTLREALKGIPAFAISFVRVMWIWTAHAHWSRAYGLDDVRSRGLSLLLVMLVLVFVYPLRMVFGAMFSAFTGNALPAAFELASLADLPDLFITFSLAFGSMGATLCALYHHAWRRRDALGLDAAERVLTRAQMATWACVPVVAALSIALAFLVPATRASGQWVGAPGYVFFLLTLSGVGIGLWSDRQLARLRAAPDAAQAAPTAPPSPPPPG